MSSRTKINKDSIRREVAADLGIKIDADDPLLLAAHIAAIATRDTIAQEREHNADNQLMSFGDVRTVLMDVRDDAVEINKQLLGIVLMRLEEELRERYGAFMDEKHRTIAGRAVASVFLGGMLLGGSLGIITYFALV